jgi:hypothetical protein
MLQLPRGFAPQPGISEGFAEADQVEQDHAGRTLPCHAGQTSHGNDIPPLVEFPLRELLLKPAEKIVYFDTTTKPKAGR